MSHFKKKWVSSAIGLVVAGQVNAAAVDKPSNLLLQLALAEGEEQSGEHGQSAVSSNGESQQEIVVGAIKGKVVSAEDERPLRNVQVKVAGNDLETVTDRYGNFELELNPGTYQLILEHVDFRSVSLQDLQVVSKMTLNVDAELTELADSGVLEDEQNIVTRPEIEEVFVTARYTPHDPIEQERMSSTIVDNIDFSQIARFDDSMISAAIKRVVGVTLEDDRYAIVRGMKSRYQSTYFNGVILPSTDPARRDLPLDIFPASIMQGLSLQKSATAEVPGTATAGHIDMRTKDIPDQPFLKISGSYGFWDGMNDDVLAADGGDDDEWGMDDGTRDIPDELKAVSDFYFSTNDSVALPPEQAEAVGESIRQTGIYKGNAESNGSVDVTGGYSWELDEQRIGLIGALRYSNKWSSNVKSKSRFKRGTTVDGTEGIVPSTYADVQDTNNIIDASGMLNLLWQVSDSHKLGLDNLIVRHTTNSVEQESLEIIGDINIGLGAVDNDRERIYQIDWIEEQLVSHQLWGEHSFENLGGLGVKWRVINSNATFDRPDAKTYTYSTLGLDESFRFRSSGSFFSWEDMEEDNEGYRVDFNLPIFQDSAISAELKAGIYNLSRDREGYQRTWMYSGDRELDLEIEENPNPAEILIPDNIVGSNSEPGYLVETFSIKPSDDVGLIGDNYLVEQESDAIYFSASVNFWQKVTATIGARQEDFHIGAEMYAYTPEPLTDLIDEDRTLPSLGMTWFISESWQMRAAYTETVSWPEVFEVMPRRFRDYETLVTYQGNPNLKTADIENYDLRLEWYPDQGESISLALFYKDLTTPIENTFIRTSDDFDLYTFENVPGASVSGVEFDLRKEFTFGKDDGHEVFVQFNYADITSEVDLPADTQEYDKGRPLQGQPEYIVNLQLGYDHLDTNQELTLAFNRKGLELAVVSPFKSGITNVYEQPFDDLKLIYKKSFYNGLSVGVSLENLLDSEKVFEYERHNLPYLTYEPGRSVKLKVNFTY